MPLVWEDSSGGPGTHALIIGVSYYRHILDGSDLTQDGDDSGLEQLTGAARSAAMFARWLSSPGFRMPERPLKSLRVLLSPAKDEVIPQQIADLLPPEHAATVAAVKKDLLDFRAACDADVDNVAVVYVAGHGVQLTKNGAILLLEDYAGPYQLTKLEAAVDMAGVHAGFNHAGTSARQLWFVDTCRQKPAVADFFESLEGALTLDSPDNDTHCESSPMFLASSTGASAYGRENGVSLFNEGLLWALEGGASTGPDQSLHDGWHVSVTGLIHHLPSRVAELADEEELTQIPDPAGRIQEALVTTFEQPPQVPVELTLKPSRPTTSATISRGNEVFIKDREIWPIIETMAAGLYVVQLASPPWVDVLKVEPPECDEEVG